MYWFICDVIESILSSNKLDHSTFCGCFIINTAVNIAALRFYIEVISYYN